MTIFSSTNATTPSRHLQIALSSDETLFTLLADETVAEEILEHMTNCSDCAERLAQMDAELADGENQLLSEAQRQELARISQRLSKKFSK